MFYLDAKIARCTTESNTMNILIIEDDHQVAASMKIALSNEGHFSEVSTTADEGLNAAKSNIFDAIVLDINLPDGDGFQLLKSLRNNKITTPVLVVSGRTGVADKVLALHSGADGYLTKPFDRQELAATLAAIIRRYNGHSDSLVTTGPISVDFNKREVRVYDKPVRLTAKEYLIIELLSLRKTRVITKPQIINHLYGGMDEPESKIIDVFICKLRKKIAKISDGENYIHTIWGQGYSLRDEPVSSH